MIRFAGEDRLRPGSITVAKTSLRVPTRKAGFRSSEVTRVIRKISRLGRGKRLFSYDVEVRFTGRDGKRKKKTIEGIGIPPLKSGTKRRLRSKRTGKLETSEQALQRLVREEIQRQVFNEIRKEFGRYDAAVEAGRMTASEAKRKLAAIKRSRRSSFRVTFKRQVLPRAARKRG
jgi:hypothetical protein